MMQLLTGHSDQRQLELPVTTIRFAGGG